MSLVSDPHPVSSFDISQRKRKTKAPCQICFLHQNLCICSLIPSIKVKTKISLIIHAKELKRTTNTGRLAIKALQNSEMRVRGLSKTTLDLTDLLKDEYETFLFYPADSAVVLDQKFLEKIAKPIQLIVPDGNWRQASKVHYRHHELKHIQRVTIKAPTTTKLFMRAEIKEEGMATLEAIAYALGVIEGEAVQNQILNLYEAKLKRTLFGRGQLQADDIKIS
ncbi:MAG: tRNA-uridine aminocarboxypropyltransferase [Pseudobdellovibrio sp.]